MKAACRPHYGTPDDILVMDVAKPIPGPADVIVKVHCTTINRTDCGVLSGKPFVFRFFVGLTKPRSPILGTDFAGTVVEVGATNQRWQVGDRVMGFNDNGLPTQAEFVRIAPAIAMTKIPDGIGFAVAAASIEGFHYALNFLSKTNIEAGQHILVVGGTGAIGSAMILILKDRGCKVTAVCREAHFAKVQALGADRVIDYVRQDFATHLMGEKFAHVFDAVGKSSFGVCRQLMADEGVYSSSELGPGAENILLALTTQLRRGQKVIFPVPVDIPRTLTSVTQMLTTGKLRPLIDKTVSLNDVAAAYRYAASGNKVGNIVLQIVD